MKACLLQTMYSATDPAFQAEGFAREIAMLDSLDDQTIDIIVIPEYAESLFAPRTHEEFCDQIEKYAPIIEQKAREAAIRCHAIVFANFGYKTERGYRNTTHVFGRDGNIVGRYFKQHPAPSEIKNPYIDTDYAESDLPVTIVEVEGIRYAFRTCYDFYFYEDLVNIARARPDIIIGCSHQRTDTHEALALMNRFHSYQANAYLLRASVSLGEGSAVCGCTCAIAPDGTMLGDMKNDVGILTVEFDPTAKYYKAAGFGGKPKAHFEYVDEGRRR